jgi:hypothetical protein
MGVLTVNEVREMRGYKKYEATAEGEFVDKPVMYNGTGAVPFEELATGSVDNTSPDDTLDNAAKFLEGLQKRFTYERPPAKPKT